MSINNIEEEAYLGKLKSCFDDGEIEPVLDCRAANVTSLLDKQIAYFDVSSEKCIDPEDIKVCFCYSNIYQSNKTFVV